jgi:hypothetical protein
MITQKYFNVHAKIFGFNLFFFSHDFRELLVQYVIGMLPSEIQFIQKNITDKTRTLQMQLPFCRQLRNSPQY